MHIDTDDALITIDIHIVESPNSDEPIQIACVTFNNLDVIGMYIHFFNIYIYILTQNTTIYCLIF